MGDVTKLPVKKTSGSEDEIDEAFFIGLLKLCREYGVNIQRGGQVQFMTGSGPHPKMVARYLLHTVDAREVAVEKLEHDPKTGGYQVITVRD